MARPIDTMAPSVPATHAPCCAGSRKPESAGSAPAIASAAAITSGTTAERRSMTARAIAHSPSDAIAARAVSSEPSPSEPAIASAVQTTARSAK